jgi:hypothetical protein
VAGSGRCPPPIAASQHRHQRWVHLSGTGTPEGLHRPDGSTWLQTDSTTTSSGWIGWVTGHRHVQRSWVRTGISGHSRNRIRRVAKLAQIDLPGAGVSTCPTRKSCHHAWSVTPPRHNCAAPASADSARNSEAYFPMQFGSSLGTIPAWHGRGERGLLRRYLLAIVAAA